MSTLHKNKHPNFSSPAAHSAARPYDRQELLPRLIGLWPAELQDISAAGTSKILALLRKALRSERSRGRAGHWSYDLNRHLALAEALKAERAHLRGLEHFPAKRMPVCLAKMRQNKELVHFPSKGMPVCARKMQQNKELEPRSDSIGAEKALDAAPGKSRHLVKRAGAVRNGEILHLPAMASERALPKAGSARAVGPRSAGALVAELGGIQLIGDADRQGHIVA